MTRKNKPAPASETCCTEPDCSEQASHSYTMPLGYDEPLERRVCWSHHGEVENRLTALGLRDPFLPRVTLRPLA